MVPIKEAEPKKKKKQLIQHQAYLTNVNQQIHSNKFSPLPKNWKELLSYLYKFILRKGSNLTEGSSKEIFNSTPYQDSWYSFNLQAGLKLRGYIDQNRP